MKPFFVNAWVAVICMPLVAAGCTMPTAEPAVASFNEASVGIRLNGNALQFAGAQAQAEAYAKADAKAAEICSRGPNRKAEFASSRQIPTSQYTFDIERLYLCLR
jgi:hypothetical protein